MVTATSNQSITPDVRGVVEDLNLFVTRPDVLAALQKAKAEAGKTLQQHPDLSSAVVEIDLAQLGWAASDLVGSARVVVTRHHDDSRIERHGNSTQYLFAIDGPVETHVDTAQGWRMDRYGQGDSADLENRWHVVAPNTWHKSVTQGVRDWGIVAFHSARKVSDEYRQEKRLP